MAQLNRKTTTILCAAGGLVAAAVILGARTQAGHVGVKPTPPPREHVAPVDVCGAGGPARAEAIVPAGSLRAALSSGKLLRGSGGEAYVAFDLEARDAAIENRPPLDVALVLDRSGSMVGDPMTRAREAARGVVDRLGPRDRIAVVQFDDAAQLLVPLTFVDDAGRQRLRAAIDGIEEGNKTNIHDGLALGRDELLRDVGERRLGRLILMSDGMANVGVVDPGAIAGVAGLAAQRGLRVTAMGLGVNYNEDLMEAVADRGRGSYYFVRHAGELAQVFAGELESLQATVATGAELRLEPSCTGVEIAEVYGYPTRRDGAATIVELADLAGGERRKIVARLRIPDGKLGPLAVVSATFRYTDTSGKAAPAGRVALGIEVTDDTRAAAASADTTVIAKVAQVETGAVMREAAQAYAAGDAARATAMIDRHKQKTSDKMRLYNVAPAAAAPALEALDEAKQEMTADPYSASGAAATKGSKSKARSLMH